MISSLHRMRAQKEAVALSAKVEQLMASEKFSEAEPLARQALASWENAVGPDHAEVATALDRLAELYKKLGRSADTEPLYTRKLAIKEKMLGPEHPDVATVLRDMAFFLYARCGQDANAERFYLRAQAIYEKSFGPHNIEVALTLHGLAKLYSQQRRHADAERLYVRALEIIEKHTGSDASDICRPAMGMPKQNASPWISDRYAAALMGRANNLFKERRDQRRFTETMEIERLYTRVLAIVERTHGPDHPFIAAARSALTALHSFVEQAPTVTSLDDEWRQEVAALTAKGQEILGVEPGADPAAAAYSVDQRICELSERPESDSTNDKVAIAVAYGDAIARVTGWQWNLYLEKRDTSLAVVSPDAKYVLLPVDFIGRQLAATREVTALLLFNMLAAGHYPAARPGDLDVIG